MRFLLLVILWAVALYVAIPPIVRFIKDWRSLHFAMSRIGNPLSEPRARSLWLESLKQMNASDRHKDFANALGGIIAFAILGIGYLIAGLPGMVVAFVIFAAIVLWRIR